MNYRSIHVHNFSVFLLLKQSCIYINYFLIPKNIKVLNNSILSLTLVSKCPPILWRNEHWDENEEAISRSRAPMPHSLGPQVPSLSQRITFYISKVISSSKAASFAKGLSRVFFNNTVQKHQFFGAQLSSQSNYHIHT